MEYFEYFHVLTSLHLPLSFTRVCVGGFSYELTVAPSGPEFVKAIGQSAVFTCTVIGSGAPTDRVTITWKDNVGRAVSETVGIK